MKVDKKGDLWLRRRPNTRNTITQLQIYQSSAVFLTMDQTASIPNWEEKNRMVGSGAD